MLIVTDGFNIIGGIDAGKLIFSSISPYHVITQGNLTVADLVIESVQ